MHRGPGYKVGVLDTRLPAVEQRFEQSYGQASNEKKRHPNNGLEQAHGSIAFSGVADGRDAGVGDACPLTLWPTKLALPYVNPGHWPWLQVLGLALLMPAGTWRCRSPRGPLPGSRPVSPPTGEFDAIVRSRMSCHALC